MKYDDLLVFSTHFGDSRGAIILFFMAYWYNSVDIDNRNLFPTILVFNNYTIIAARPSCHLVSKSPVFHKT